MLSSNTVSPSSTADFDLEALTGLDGYILGGKGAGLSQRGLSAAVAAKVVGIPSVLFITTNGTMASNMFHLYKKKGSAFSYKSVYYRAYEYWNVKEVLESEANGHKDKDRVIEGVENLSSIVLAKSFKDIKGKYADYFTELTSKRVVLVGPLVVNVVHVDNVQNNVIHWLDTTTTRSTIYVCFGSAKFPRGHLEGNLTIEHALPQGFFERVQNSCLIVEGWALQAKIFAHKNIGVFVSHCGWSSVMEAMKFVVLIIAMPMHLDQPVNVCLVVQLGLGKKALRDGENVRAKCKKVSHHLKIKGDEVIDIVADELLQLCNSAQPHRVVGGGLYKTRSKAFVLGKSWAGKALV
ncbi:beta-D-glucosyl crocetin beta-1,6-glucosyltransferase-like protein [Tanacetum coccineum]